MYNRYIPNGAQYHPVEPPPRGGHSGHSGSHSGHHGGPSSSGSPNRRPGGLGGLLNGLLQGARGEDGGNQAIDSLLKSFHLESLDTGDILLALIVLFLILEDGDDLDLIITLGLMILFSLGES